MNVRYLGVELVQGDSDEVKDLEFKVTENNVRFAPAHFICPKGTKDSTWILQIKDSFYFGGTCTCTCYVFSNVFIFSDETDLSVETFRINGDETSVYLRYEATTTARIDLTETSSAQPWPEVVRRYPRAVRLYASSKNLLTFLGGHMSFCKDSFCLWISNDVSSGLWDSKP